MKLVSNQFDRVDTSEINNGDDELLDAYSRTIVDVAKKVSRSVVKVSVVKKNCQIKGRETIQGQWRPMLQVLLSHPMDC